MINRELSRTCYKKEGNAWKETYKETNKTIIYEQIARALHAKYIAKAPYIKRLIDYSNYDGTRTITIYYDNNIKDVFIVDI